MKVRHSVQRELIKRRSNKYNYAFTYSVFCHALEKNANNKLWFFQCLLLNNSPETFKCLTTFNGKQKMSQRWVSRLGYFV